MATKRKCRNTGAIIFDLDEPEKKALELHQKFPKLTKEVDTLELKVRKLETAIGLILKKHPEIKKEVDSLFLEKKVEQEPMVFEAEKPSEHPKYGTSNKRKKKKK